MKFSKIHLAFVAVLLSAAAVMAGMITVVSHSGDPNGVIEAEIGQVLTDESAGKIWVKSSGAGTTTGWQSLNVAALQGATRGTITLTSGTGATAVTGATTNSLAFLTGRGTTNAGSLSATATSGTLTVNSSSGSDARVINYLIFNPQ